MKTENFPELAVVYKSIGIIKASSRNARTHSKEQVRQIATSIEEFGFVNPILIDRDNSIVAGHGRVEAAKLLGMVQVPTIRLEGLTADQIRAFAIAENRLAENAGWDNSLLAIELQHLLTIDGAFDATITGFEVPEIDLILQEAAGKQDEDDAFDFEETSASVTQSGDLWQLGKHRIYCGNALNADCYSALMRGLRATAVFTDPPFNDPIDGYVAGFGKIHHREFAMASGEMSVTEYTGFLSKTFRNLELNSDDGSLHYVCLDWRHLPELLAASRDVFSEFKNMCIWVKESGGQGSLYRSRHELVLVFKSGKAKHRNNIQLGQYGRYRTNVWEYPRVRSLAKNGEEQLSGLHPTIKPVAMVADAIQDCTARNDIILDPFLGSGTTVIAAERTGRICYGMDLDSRYVDTVVRRWQRFTKLEAIHESTGQKFSEREQETTNARP
jgi:DNA modification methylase